MGSTVRFGVSMDKELVEALDELTLAYDFPNRSQTIRHMIHEEVRRHGAQDETVEVTAIVSLLFKTGTHLTRVPIDPYPSLSIHTNLQSHITRDIVLKILVVRGLSGEIHRWASRVMKSAHVVGTVSVVALDSMVKEFSW